ncbi:MAG TPA: DUF397 domain-containing protein [Pseudonocardiaceae bacterium]|nr:DUF397 domain-containing protein [Pseudonocardiaceae bacterium]
MYDDLLWRKSRRSGQNNNCVEVAPFNGGAAVRDSKNPAGAVLTFTGAAWSAFTASIRAGDFR